MAPKLKPQLEYERDWYRHYAQEAERLLIRIAQDVAEGHISQKLDSIGALRSYLESCRGPGGPATEAMREAAEAELAILRREDKTAKFKLGVLKGQKGKTAVSVGSKTAECK